MINFIISAKFPLLGKVLYSSSRDRDTDDFGGHYSLCWGAMVGVIYFIRHIGADEEVIPHKYAEVGMAR